MARLNKFKTKKVIIKDKKDFGEVDTFDGLPKFEPNKSGVVTHQIVKGNGAKAKLILSCYY